MSEKIERLLELLKRDSYQKRNIVLASGEQSEHYIDCKKTVLSGEGHVLVGKHIAMALQGKGPFDACAGVALGGCALASAVSMWEFLAYQCHMPALYVRSEAKDHGTRAMIEGPAIKGNKVVLLEDVITTGGSSLKAIKLLREGGFDVQLVVCLIDREAGGPEMLLADAGVKVESLFRLQDFIDA